MFIICSARPGVGKTFLARLLIGFHVADARPVRAYDLDGHDAVLTGFEPARTSAADIGATQGQMALFDDLIAGTGRVKVVDLPHTATEPFFTIVEQIGFLDEAQARDVDPVVLFCADASAASAAGYATLRTRFPQATIVPVLNEAIARIGNVREAFPISRSAAVPLRIPALAPPLKVMLDRHRITFAELRDTLPTNVPTEVGFELRSWTKRAFLEFRELELRILLEKLSSSLRLPKGRTLS